MATIDGATSFTQQVLAVWTDGKTSHAVRPTGPRAPGGGGSGAPGEPRQQDHLLPFQYQIPINKYSTLHSIAVKRSASAAALASQQRSNEDQKTRVFTTGTRVEPDEMDSPRFGSSRYRVQVDGENESISLRKIEMVEQIGRQLDLLKDNDSEAAAAVIKVLRQQVDSFEKESQQRHHHHHQQPSTQQQQQQQQQQKSNHHATESKTEDKGVQADWVLLQETEAELMIIRPPQRLSVPDLTKPRQRIGSKSHSVDDDDADEDGVAKQASSVSAAEAEEELRLVNDRLVSARLREANLLAHLKDYRHRADDLRRLISLRDSQIERLEDEIARLKDALVEGRGKEKELQSFISDLQLTLDDLHSKYDEYVVLGQLRDSEHQQVVEGLEQEVAKLKEEKLALSYGQPALGYQSLQHLSKNAVHFQSTGSLVPTSNASYQNHDKAMRGHRSVESSPSMRRCVRYKEAALAHDRNDPWDPDDDDHEPSNTGFQRPSPKHGGSYSANQSPINARRGILHDKTGDNSRATPGTYNGRCTVDEADEDGADDDGGATCRRVMSDKDLLRRGALGPAGAAARANIPLEGEPEVPRTRTLVRKASYICGIQQHSVLDDLTDSVD